LVAISVSEGGVVSRRLGLGEAKLAVAACVDFTALRLGELACSFSYVFSVCFEAAIAAPAGWAGMKGEGMP
jgi:hypothetical protein